MTTEVARLAYTAGLLDGEGSIHAAATSSGFPALIITVQMCDPTVISWLKDTFGGYVYSVRRRNPPTLPQGTKPKSYRPQFMWRLNAGRAADFLQAVMPYLIVKRTQAVLALDLRKLAGRRGVRVSIERRMEGQRIGRTISLLNRTGSAG